MGCFEQTSVGLGDSQIFMTISSLRRVALFAAHFSPSNLASVHRARLLAQHLAEFGWEPIVVTTHWKHYEEPLDWDLNTLVSPQLRVVRTGAVPVRPLRLIGDIGIRGFVFHLRALREMAARRELDFLHITIPSNYSALLGPALWRSHGVPYGIDYIDPWVHDWPGSEVLFSKAWASCRLARWLEPRAVRQARLITGISPGYYQGVLERHPELSQQAVTAAMPYGASEQDFTALRAAPRQPFLFTPGDGLFHVVYAGAMLPKAYVVLERLCMAVDHLRRTQPALYARLRLHFVGTGKSPADPQGHNVLPVAERMGVADVFTEHPQRIGYVDVLNHLCLADAVLVLGSTEPHYSPSKVYQAVHSRKPVLALLHEASTAVAVLRDSGAGEAVSFTENQLPDAESLAAILTAFIACAAQPRHVDWGAFEPYSARSSARILAEALDKAWSRRQGKR